MGLRENQEVNVDFRSNDVLAFSRAGSFPLVSTKWNLLNIKLQVLELSRYLQRSSIYMKVMNGRDWIEILHKLLFSPFRVCHIDVCRWFLTGVWVTANLLKSPELFSVFQPISVMLLSGCCPFINPLVTVPSAPITIRITVTFMFHIFFNFLVSPR